MQREFPSDWRDQPCFLVAVPKPLAPYASGLLKILENRGFWTEDAFTDAYTAVIELEACFMTTCLNDLFTRQDDLYRMLDTVLRGQSYEVTSEDPLVVTPAIPHTVDLGFVDQDSIFGQLDRTTQLLDNSVNGTETPLYSYSPSVKDLLQSVIDALSSDTTDLDSILTQLELIATLVA